MAKAGAWPSNLLDLEVLGLRSEQATPRAHSCKLEMSGRFLAYDITLDGGWIFLSVAVMDRADAPESLLTIADNAENWLNPFANSSPRSNAAQSASYSPDRWRLTARTELLGYRMTTVTAARKRKNKRRALRTSFASKRRKLASKKAPLVVPTTARGHDDERAWLD